VRNAVNLPYLDAKTYEQVRPYLVLGEKLGKLLCQLAPPQVDRLHVTYGGKAQELPNIDPITRAVLMGFLSRSSVKDLNNVNVRSIASTVGITVEEKRSSEPVTFNEWLHVQVFRGQEKVASAGGTFFGHRRAHRVHLPNNWSGVRPSVFKRRLNASSEPSCALGIVHSFSASSFPAALSASVRFGL